MFKNAFDKMESLRHQNTSHDVLHCGICVARHLQECLGHELSVEREMDDAVERWKKWYAPRMCERGEHCWQRVLRRNPATGVFDFINVPCNLRRSGCGVCVEKRRLEDHTHIDLAIGEVDQEEMWVIPDVPLDDHAKVQDRVSDWNKARKEEIAAGEVSRALFFAIVRKDNTVGFVSTVKIKDGKLVSKGAASDMLHDAAEVISTTVKKPVRPCHEWSACRMEMKEPNGWGIGWIGDTPPEVVEAIVENSEGFVFDKKPNGWFSFLLPEKYDHEECWENMRLWCKIGQGPADGNLWLSPKDVFSPDSSNDELLDEMGEPDPDEWRNPYNHKQDCDCEHCQMEFSTC